MGLFSKKKKDAEANPYAQEVPYANPMTPYQEARNNLAQGAAPGGLPSNPRANSIASTAPPSYHSQAPSPSSSRFGNDKYGTQNGYGSNRYDSAPAPAGRNQGSGYGGFDDDAGRGDLFGGAASRYQANPGRPSPSVQPSGAPDNDPNKNNLFGNARDRYNPMPQAPQADDADDEYGGYGATRELTEEELEEKRVQDVKDQIKQTKKDSAASVMRSNQMAEDNIARLQASRLRLAQQDEMLTQTEQNLNMAAAHSRDAEDKTKELKKLNGSMFRPVGQSKKKRALKMEEDMQRHRMEREAREATRADGFAATQRMETTFKAYERNPGELLGSSKADKSKFSFEDDSEDEENEAAIDEGLQRLGRNASLMNQIAADIGEDINQSISKLDRIADKSDRVDDHVRLNRLKLDGIK